MNYSKYPNIANALKGVFPEKGKVAGDASGAAMRAREGRAELESFKRNTRRKQIVDIARRSLLGIAAGSAALGISKLRK